MSKRYKIIEKIKKMLPLNLKLKLIKLHLNTKKVNSIQNKFTTDKPKLFVLLGTDYPNLGDHALTLSHKEFLQNNFPEYEVVEYSVDETLNAIEFLKNKISKDDIITIKGGGNIGIEYFREELLRRKILNSFKAHPVILFPQTVYFPQTKLGDKEFNNTIDIFRSRDNIHVFLRDVESFKLLKEKNVKNIYLVPDIVFTMKGMNKNDISRGKKNILLCLRNDREKAENRMSASWLSEQLTAKGYQVEITDTVVDFDVNSSNREDVLVQKLNDFSASHMVITDRLHGMIFSYITNTPCLIFQTYNHKVTGQYEWIKTSNAVSLIEDKTSFWKSFEKMEKIYNSQEFNFIEVENKYDLIKETIRKYIKEY
ncbi:polysaccharide pyruvyl transferase family protein [Enterococcus mundtii]|uniref:polysaccharide pyruvyl transferase family protein n=1 Tax=Enterococcus TaxID=1350 RepID=UPI0008E07A79|nr:polysaccharide pyruvyl transferase family protein [Enterococcus mundtii]NBA62431.1 hypothetical protein [Enterococcus mundtii]SFM17644.1 Exopolysaccharide biosynthesis protein EpsI, predicted pyruvyl transferase [Enterococcus mundtii]